MGMKTMNAEIDFKQIVAVCADAVAVCDQPGKITFWNAAAERMFGFTAAEAIGNSLDIIIPDRHRKRHWDAWAVAMASGTTRYGDDLLKVPAVTKDGRTLSIAFTIAMLRDEAGTVNGCVSFIRDETKRFHDERALRKRLAELEAATKG
jgi:PAS domain S-box-containing protein